MARAPKNVVDLDNEDSVGAVGIVGKVVSATSRNKTGATRPAFEDTPHCPHCGGRMHMNLPGATVNFECLWRQFSVSNGSMSSPADRLPNFTAENFLPDSEMGQWVQARTRSRKAPLSYGKMDVAGGGPATYAAARTAGKSISEIAEDVEVPVKAKRKAKKGTDTATIPVKASKSGKTARIEVPEGFSFADAFDEPAPKAKKTKKAKRIEEQTVVASTKPKGKAKVTASAPSTNGKAPKAAAKSDKRMAALAKAAAR